MDKAHKTHTLTNFSKKQKRETHLSQNLFSKLATTIHTLKHQHTRSPKRRNNITIKTISITKNQSHKPNNKKQKHRNNITYKPILLKDNYKHLNLKIMKHHQYIKTRHTKSQNQIPKAHCTKKTNMLKQQNNSIHDQTHNIPNQTKTKEI